MGYAKERGKLEKLSEKTTKLATYDEKSLKVITDIYEQYSHTVRILKNKDGDNFMELYQNELQEVKECKRLLKQCEEEADRQTKFNEYKAVLAGAIEKTIQVAKDIV